MADKFLITLSFLIISLGGLAIEVLAIKRSQMAIKDLFKNSLSVSRAFALISFVLGLLAAALHPFIPLVEQLGLVSLSLIILGLVLLISASFYMMGSFEDNRYWFIPDIIDRYIKPWRKSTILSVIENAKEPQSLKNIVDESRKIAEGTIPKIEPLSSLGWKAIEKHSFQEFHIELTIQELEKEGACQKKRGKYTKFEHSNNKS